MSLKQVQYIKFCPLLLENDVLSLTPQVLVKQSNLVDTRMGTTHVLHGHGQSIAQALSKGIEYHALIKLAEKHSVNSFQLHELLGFLNNIGGLQQRRVYTHHLQALYIKIRHLLLGIHYSPLCYRASGILRHVCLAVLRATTPVFLASGVVATVWISAGFGSSTIIAASYCLLIFWLSLVTHECAHVQLLHKYRIPSDMLQIGMRLGVIHPRLTLRQEVRVSLTGPLAGITTSLLGGLLMLNVSLTVFAGCIIVSLLHLASLLPWYGDGHHLFKAIHQRIYREKSAKSNQD